MSRGYAMVFAGFATLCLGLLAVAAMPIGLPTALDLAFGESISREQLGIVELVLMAVTVLLSVVLTADGVITGIQGRNRAPDRGQLTEHDAVDWVERLIDR